MTLQDAMDQVAKKYGAKNFYHAIHHTNLINKSDELYKEAAELYAAQFKDENEELKERVEDLEMSLAANSQNYRTVAKRWEEEIARLREDSNKLI